MEILKEEYENVNEVMAKGDWRGYPRIEDD